MSKVEKFGKYLLLEKVAVGGMAEVYLAKSTGANGVNKFVAIKRILPQYTNNPEFISMFKEEAKVAINLGHSNIVSIYDFGIEDHQFFIVMEYVEGRNLRQIINEMKKSNKSFSIDQAVYMIKEAAAGLNHAHRCVDSQSGKPLNITHRDMSPQNVMVSFEGETKVIDFGIAKAENDNDTTKAGTLKGKFSYMSPEQAEGYPIDPRTDVFALGIILWELLANDRLFTGSNEGAILRKVRDCQVPAIRKINPLVPQELERIVMKALAKDKNVRYQTAANFHKDLNLFINTQYPDFSIHDFSQFIRDGFKLAYLEGKEKLRAFSKMEAPTPPEPEVTTITPKEKISEPPPPVAKAATNENPLPILSEINEPVNLSGLRSASIKKSIPNGQTFQHTTTAQYRSGTRIVAPRKRVAGIFQALTKISFIVTLGIASLFGYKTYVIGNAKLPVAKIKKYLPKKDDALTEPVEIAPLAATGLSITSEPPGAKIFIDGVSTSQHTPAVVTVNSNKDVTVTLQKDGFYRYQIVKNFTRASSLKARLSPTPAMGYVNIYLVNGGEDAVISVNGVRLEEKPPINQYAVPADSEIEISAVNPFTNAKDKALVRVSANKISNVQLILGRIPASATKPQRAQEKR